MTRQTGDGIEWKRTSISMDPRVRAVFEARNIQISAWVDRMAKLTFGLTSVDDEIENVKEIAAVIATMQDEDRRRAEEVQYQEASAVTAMQTLHAVEKDTIRSVRASADAERERLEAHGRKLRDTWLVLVKKKKVIPGNSTWSKLPENDANMIFEGHWKNLAREISKLAGEPYTPEEVTEYARRHATA